MNKTVTMWVAGLISFIFSLLTAITMYAFSRSADGSDKMKEEISKKADAAWVKDQDDKLRQEIKEVKADLKESVDVIRQDVKEIRNYIMKEK